MVLQRDVSSTVWGFAVAGTTVKTSFAGNTYTATAGADTIWRQQLPATPATAAGQTISFSASTGEKAALNDVVFGDVYICSGQSSALGGRRRRAADRLLLNPRIPPPLFADMQFSLGGTANATQEAEKANGYPNIRVFTVGQGTSSKTPLSDLATIEQPWAVATNKSVDNGGAFDFFSSVCWFFGKGVHDGLGGATPVGLISNNWGGTPVEHWADSAAFARCNRSDTDSTLYNSMIHPYEVGPMALTGFTWYQGGAYRCGTPPPPLPPLPLTLAPPPPTHSHAEANTANAATANAYACLFPSMIQSWRTNFGVPSAYFGFIQLSTWCVAGDAIPLLRVAQMSAVSTQGAGYAVNADHGAGCNIHPPQKQNCGYRLANSALALQYKKRLTWKSPSYKSAAAGADGASATIALNDVTPAGLALRPSANAGTLDCARSAGVCAWAALQFNDSKGSWVNATVALTADGQGMLLAAPPPAGATAVTGTSYGWGAVPFLTVYLADAGLDLPVQAWQAAL